MWTDYFSLEGVTDMVLMRKRVVLAAAAASLLSFGLAACNDSDGEVVAPGPPASDGGVEQGVINEYGNEEQDEDDLFAERDEANVDRITTGS